MDVLLEWCGLANDHASMLSTTANPTDGLRFERDAEGVAESRTS